MRVIGVDSSTQSVKVLLVDAADGTVVAAGRAPHPDGVECDPARWEAALHQAAAALPGGAAGLGIAAQQHGMVALDEAGEPVRPASLWNDTRAAGDAEALVAELGAGTWADAVGSVPVASFTVAKLRWLARTDPAAAARVRSVLLPHDWLTWRLAGGAPVTDRGDASGTGYYSPVTGEYRLDLLERALGRPAALPRVAAPNELIGTGRSPAPDGGAVAVSAGTGDNMAAALGLGARPGDLILSLGTSGTAFAVSSEPSRDPRGLVAGFADATGRYLPLACTLNAARVLDTVAGLLAVGHDELSALALGAPPGAGGLVLLPYLDGERTPNLPDATGTLAGVTRDLNRATLARAAIEGVLCALADAADALAVAPERILLIGGAAASPAVRQIASAVLGRPVTVPAEAEYVALGAARQAAWALSGDPSPPDWPVPATTVEADPAPQVRERFRELRESRHPGALGAMP